MAKQIEAPNGTTKPLNASTVKKGPKPLPGFHACFMRVEVRRGTNLVKAHEGVMDLDEASKTVKNSLRGMDGEFSITIQSKTGLPS
jgi:hypothetical protein